MAGNTDDRISQIEKLLVADPAEAELQAARFLADFPGHQVVLLLQAIARRLQGNYVAAIEILQPLSRSCPDAPLVHLQLGLALRESGQFDAALQSIRRAVTVKADFSDAWLALADLHTRLEDTDAADAAYVRYASCSANDPHIQEIVAAMRDKRLAEAESMLRVQLEQRPTDIVALCMLADVAERSERTAEAELLLQQCLTLAPGYARARHNHAVILHRQNKASDALREVEYVLATEPANLDARKLKAAILVRLREYDASIKVCEDLLREHPHEPTVWTSLGHMLKTVGRREDSVQAYRKAIAQAPYLGEPYWSLANLKTGQVNDNELKTMLAQLGKENLSVEDRLHFHFAIGKALEDRSDFAESFRHYAEGNRLRLAKRPYNGDELSDHVARCKALFTAAFFAERPSFGATNDDPIFIVGLPRSGSTLVEQILASHTRVEGTTELPEIAAMANALAKWQTGAAAQGYPDVLGAMQEEAFRELGLSYIEHTRIQRKTGTAFFIDKMPNNFAHLGLIHLILPRARIIDVRRHPMACGFSLFKEHFAGGQNYSYSLEEIGRYYRHYVELMTHFDSVLPGRVHRVIYESLVDNTESEIRRLLEYCGLEFEQSCVDFHRNERPVSTASSEQVRSPIFRAAIDHWHNYEPWLGPLKATLGDLAERHPAP